MSAALKIVPATDAGPKATVTVARAQTKALCKIWKQDGTVQPYPAERLFRAEVREIASHEAMIRLIEEAADDPKLSIVLGQPTDAAIQSFAPRNRDTYSDAPSLWLEVDVDGFPSTTNPIARPAETCREFIAAELPAEFHNAAFTWQLTGSAGHPTANGCLHARLFFRLKRPLTLTQKSQWACAVASSYVDAKIYQPARLLYLAPPQLEDGLEDPVELGFGVVQGEAAVDVLVPMTAVDAGKRPATSEVTANRNNHLTSLAGTMRRSGLTEAAINAALLAENEALPEPLPDAEVRRIARSISRYEPAPTRLAQLSMDRDKGGRPLATLNNLEIALAEGVAGVSFGEDRFRDEIVIENVDSGERRPVRDADFVNLRRDLENLGFRQIPKDLIRDAAIAYADAHQFDSAITWLRDEVPAWDGVARIETFYPVYLRTVESAYTLAIGAYMWTALAGRVLVPGIKADMVPIWVSAQGTQKQRAMKAIVGGEDLYAELHLKDDDEKKARLTRGKVIVELSELKGMRDADIETVKAWVTRSVEQWVPKYKEFRTTYPRRFVAIGTTNTTDILVDETGNRRWLPVEIGEIDVAAIERDRLQLWAEARDRFELVGIEFAQAERLAQAEHGKFEVGSAWNEPIDEWLARPDPETRRPRGDSEFSLHDVLQWAIGLDTKEIRREHELRAGRVLRRLGYEKFLGQVETGGRGRRRVWRRVGVQL